MPDRAEPILIGKIAATHGIRGQLRVISYSGEPANLTGLRSVLLKGSAGDMERFDVAGASVHGTKLLLSLKGYVEINQVLHFVGRELYADRDQLPPLDDGEYYWCDLLGLRVMTDQGDLLGSLTEIIATGSNDVYVVTAGEREYLIPALADVVLDVDLTAGTMTVSPPEGLFDL